MLLALLSAAHVAAFSYSPVFMWSGLNYFTGKNAYVQEAVQTSALGPLVHGFASQRANSAAEFEGYLNGNGIDAPKVIMLALYDSLSTEQVSGLARTGSLQSLQDSLDSSASSLVIPYTYSNSTDSFATTLADLGEVSEAASADVASPAWLKAFTNAKHGTGVVRVAMEQAQPEMLAKATAALNEVTGGKYLVILSSNTPAIASAESHNNGRKLLSANALNEMGPGECSNTDEHFDVLTNTCFRYVYMTPAIMWGIFVGVFGFFTLWLALVCLNGVQTPDVFMSKDDPGPAKGKEF